jgi:hypothetical protein
MKAAILWFAFLSAALPLSGCRPFAYGGIMVFGLPASGPTDGGGGSTEAADG